jgi:hypothetical protein
LVYLKKQDFHKAKLDFDAACKLKDRSFKSDLSYLVYLIFNRKYKDALEISKSFIIIGQVNQSNKYYKEYVSISLKIVVYD